MGFSDSPPKGRHWLAQARASEEPSPFQDLRRQARSVQRVVIGVVVAIALLPTSIFIALQNAEHDPSALGVDAVRVFVIHLVVAGGLALVISRVPMRALRRAIGRAENTYAMLGHAEKLGALGAMYAGLCHEINNPLSVIMARTKMLLGQAREGGASREMVPDLEAIDRHAARISGLIRGLLAFARQAPFEIHETDVNAVVTNVLAVIERPLARQGIRLESVLQPALPVLRACPEQLEQALVNLVNNARDAMPKGGTITIRTSREGGRVIVAVQDTGIGMTPEVQARIFEPFFTTKEAGKGTGLGLSLAFGTVKAHGGELEVQSSPGRGSLFRVILPTNGARP